MRVAPHLGSQAAPTAALCRQNVTSLTSFSATYVFLRQSMNRLQAHALPRPVETHDRERMQCYVDRVPRYHVARRAAQLIDAHLLRNELRARVQPGGP